MHKLFLKLTEEEKKEIFCDAITMLDIDAKKYLYIKASKLANKGHLSLEEADEWVHSMHPHGAHWTKQQTDSANKHHYHDIDWYAVLNMMYSDFYDESYTDERYIKMAERWFEDEDVGEHKTFNYYHYVVKK